MALSELEIATLVHRYERERDRFDKMAGTVGRVLSARLRHSAIPHVPTFRSKDPESLHRKLAGDRERHEFHSFETEFGPSLLDLAGVRILLYRPQDIDPTCALVEEIFEIPPDARFRRDHDKLHGYRARHRVVKLRPEHIGSDPATRNLASVVCEIQIVTLIDHIWNELEHDIVYKTPNGKPTREQGLLLLTLRHQLTSVGQAVGLLMEETDRQHSDSLKAIDSVDDLRVALSRRCGRTLRGDLERCFALLEGVLRTLTFAKLEALPLSDGDLNAGKQRLDEANCPVSDDDVALVMAALWPIYGRDFADIAGSWIGRRGPFSRAVRALDETSKKGRI